MKKYQLHVSHDVDEKFGRPSLAIDAEVNGKHIRSVVDTGSDSSFFTNDGLQTVGHEAGEAEVEGIVAGQGGSSLDYAIRGNFAILGKRLSKVETFGGEFIPGNDGLIGMDVLAQFKRITFDLEHKQLILED